MQGYDGDCGLRYTRENVKSGLQQNSVLAPFQRRTFGSRYSQFSKAALSAARFVNKNRKMKTNVNTLRQGTALKWVRKKLERGLPSPEKLGYFKIQIRNDVEALCLPHYNGYFENGSIIYMII